MLVGRDLFVLGVLGRVTRVCTTLLPRLKKKESELSIKDGRNSSYGHAAAVLSAASCPRTKKTMKLSCGGVPVAMGLQWAVKTVISKKVSDGDIQADITSRKQQFGEEIGWWGKGSRLKKGNMTIYIVYRRSETEAGQSFALGVCFTIEWRKSWLCVAEQKSRLCQGGLLMGSEMK